MQGSSDDATRYLFWRSSDGLIYHAILLAWILYSLETTYDTYALLIISLLQMYLYLVWSQLCWIILTFFFVWLWRGILRIIPSNLKNKNELVRALVILVLLALTFLKELDIMCVRLNNLASQKSESHVLTSLNKWWFLCFYYLLFGNEIMHMESIIFYISLKGCSGQVFYNMWRYHRFLIFKSNLSGEWFDIYLILWWLS